jgi:rRNA maturation RNase YbeY
MMGGRRRRRPRGTRAPAARSEARREGSRSAFASLRISARRGLPRFDRARLRAQLVALLGAVGRGDEELSLLLCSDSEIAELNARYRARTAPTDVLSFALLEGEGREFRGPLLGDVVISVETAARQARAGGRSLADELLRLAIHGVLHLIGYDHVRAAEARRMRALERRLFRELAA